MALLGPNLRKDYDTANRTFIEHPQDDTIMLVEKANAISERDIKKIVAKELINLDQLAFMGAIIGFIGAMIVYA